ELNRPARSELMVQRDVLGDPRAFAIQRDTFRILEIAVRAVEHPADHRLAQADAAPRRKAVGRHHMTRDPRAVEADRRTIVGGAACAVERYAAADYRAVEPHRAADAAAFAELEVAGDPRALRGDSPELAS